MATRTVRIGALVDAFAYDDGDFPSAIETDQPIKSGTPVDPDDVTRLEDIEGRLLTPVSVVNIDNPTELNSIAGVLGAQILAYQIVGAAGLNEYTLYAYDASGPAVAAPYIMDAQGAGAERWIAIGGKYSVLETYLDDLTASQVVVTDANKMLSNLAGSDTDFTVVVAIEAGGGGGVGFQYKTRALTLEKGLVTVVGAESGWNDV